MKQAICQLRTIGVICSLLLLLTGGWTGTATALTFPLPTTGNNVVGHIQWTRAKPGDTFCSIGRRFDIAYFQLIEANPSINPDQVPAGTIVVVPTRFILPPVPRKGIVISLAELRLYYFPPDSHTVIIHPIGIGREGWCTPLGITKIIAKTVNPVWTVPESIKKDRANQGVILPNSVQPGPENPLGGYAMRLGIQKQTYLIHGTNDFTGVGRRSSSGCIRMLPEDIEALFPKVAVGTQVNIVNAPYKAGWYNNKLYLEAHVPLQEQKPNGEPDLAAMKNTIQAAISGHSGTIYWNTAKQIAEQQNGVPQTIGHLGETPEEG